MSPRSTSNGSGKGNGGGKKEKAPKAVEKRRVTLVVPRLEAADVVATGDFTGWSVADGVHLKQRRDGCWTAALSVTPGEHQYRLLVDGEWRNNPGAERRVANGLGSENDVIVVE